jgi:hypothetical protein
MSEAAKRLEGAGGGCNCRYTNEPYDDTIRRRLPVKRRADLKIWGIAKKADAAAKVAKHAEDALPSQISFSDLVA